MADFATQIYQTRTSLCLTASIGMIYNVIGDLKQNAVIPFLYINIPSHAIVFVFICLNLYFLISFFLSMRGMQSELPIKQAETKINDSISSLDSGIDALIELKKKSDTVLKEISQNDKSLYSYAQRLSDWVQTSGAPTPLTEEDKEKIGIGNEGLRHIEGVIRKLHLLYKDNDIGLNNIQSKKNEAIKHLNEYKQHLSSTLGFKERYLDQYFTFILSAAYFLTIPAYFYRLHFIPNL